MNRRTVEALLVGAIICLVLVLCAFGVQRRNNELGAENKPHYDMGSAEKKYLDENESISIFVEDELRYLSGEKGPSDGNAKGYLEDYMEAVLEPLGLRAEILTEDSEESEADCRLVNVTARVRAECGSDRYTTPLFQMEGAIFTGKNQIKEGLLMADRLSEKKLAEIKFDGKELKYREKRSSADLVAEAATTRADFVMGDRSSLIFRIKDYDEKHGTKLAETYTAGEKSFYRCNVCIMTEAEDEAVYQILNQAFHEADRHEISYMASQKWFEGEGPVYMRQSYENVYLPVLIILVAVLIAFFLYYLTNMNMYHELRDRMNKLKASKKELQTTFNGVKYYMAEMDLQGTVTDINPAFDTYSSGEAVRKKIWDVFRSGEESRRQLIERVKEAAEGITGRTLEIRDGKRLLAVDVFPIENAKMTTEKILFMAMDVTDERMAKQQMIQDNKMIAVGQLAAGIAHEIRNPLGIIRNYCYVLKNMDDENIRKQAIEQIEKAVDSSGSIITNLLDFSRVSAESSTRIDVEKHVRNILRLNEGMLKKKSIQTDVVCPESIHSYIAAEPFNMVMINLISNAADAVEKEGRISIHISRNEADAGKAESIETFSVRVRDTGCGIDSDTVEEIFNPFFTTKGNEGTGLGLYIVYNEVEKMQGEITVDSVPGEGTEFTVTLPVKNESSCKEE